jgi:hypothetical protein
MEPRRIVIIPETTPDGFVRKHIGANTLTSDNRAQFVRREWWQHRLGVVPESISPELVPQSFRDSFLSEVDSCYVYHPRRWERAIALGESQVLVSFLFKQELSALTEERQITDRNTYVKLIDILTADWEILELFSFEDCSNDPNFASCQ